MVCLVAGGRCVCDGAGVSAGSDAPRPENALARRQARERCGAAAEYLALHSAAVAGAGGPQRAKFGRWYGLAMVTPPGRSRLLGHQVLERAVLYEMPPESAGQEETLRRVPRQFVEMAAQC